MEELTVETGYSERVLRRLMRTRSTCELLTSSRCSPLQASSDSASKVSPWNPTCRTGRIPPTALKHRHNGLRYPINTSQDYINSYSIGLLYCYLGCAITAFARVLREMFEPNPGF